MNLRLLFLTFFLSLSGILSVKAEDKRPNVIFMLADDLGYGDLSSYNPQSKGAEPNNTPIHTPNLDRMAQTVLRSTTGSASRKSRSRSVHRCAEYLDENHGRLTVSATVLQGP